MTSEQYTVLCVDNEMNIMKALKDVLRKESYRIITTSCTREGLKILKENNVHLVIDVQKKPDMQKNGFLKKVKTEHPDTLRAIITGYNQADMATELAYNGYIDRFFLNPWYDQYFRWEIRHTLERYELIQKNKILKRKLLEQSAMNEIQKSLDTMTKKEGSHDIHDFSENILMNLPVPVMSLDDEQKITLVNHEALSLFGNYGNIQVGKPLYEYFPDHITGRISVALQTHTGRKIKKCSLNEILYNIDYIPLSDKSMIKGGILVFRQL